MKILEILRRIFVGIMLVIAVSVMIFTIISVTSFDRSDRSVFGFKAFIVLSDSMSKTDFKAGDLVLTKPVDPKELKEGDIIAFSSQNPENFGETVTHKIRKKTFDAAGQPGFVTYGTTTDTDDETVVTYPYILGKYVKAIPNVGKFFRFLKTTPGYIICIFIPFFLLILSEGIRCIRLFKKYKEEKLEEIRSEKKENQRLMNELLKLKAELSKSENGQ